MEFKISRLLIIYCHHLWILHRYILMIHQLLTLKVSHDDTNTESKILFTMNVDTQEVNIVVDKDTTEVKDDNVDSGNIVVKLVETVEVEIPTQTEQSLQTKQPLNTGKNTKGKDAGIENVLRQRYQQLSIKRNL